MQNKEDRIKLCSICEHKTEEWQCGKNQENIFSFTKNPDSECPIQMWDKGVFPTEPESPLLELGTSTPTQSILDSFGAVKIENVRREALSAQFKKKKIELRPHKNLLNPKSKVTDILYCIKNTPPGGWVEEAYKWDNFQEAYRILSAERAARIAEETYPEGRFSGRGIVMCGGGQKYFPSMFVNLRMLRLIGCTLPIEVYYIGVKEMDSKMIDILEAIDNVKCIDATHLEKKYPIRIHGGWESKVYSIINSSFEEVLMLDADNTALVNPDYLFETQEYKNNGAILWPDYACWVHDKNMWKILGIDYIDELQIESGQALINKRSCWREINMAKHYCDNSDYYFKLFYGDKEAFHFGWRYWGKDYARPPSPDWINNAVIVQRDFSGSWLFSHRAQAKFKMDKTHPICREMPYEENTLELIDELASLWCGQIWMNHLPEPEEFELMSKFENKKYDYVRVGLDSRKIELLPNHHIGEGADKLERHWHLFINGSEVLMSIHGESALTALLKWNPKLNKWEGQWLDYEKCQVELIPCD